jgi:hypothetical protein
MNAAELATGLRAYIDASRALEGTPPEDRIIRAQRCRERLLMIGASFDKDEDGAERMTVFGVSSRFCGGSIQLLKSWISEFERGAT